MPDIAVPARILIVDDERPSRQLLELMLAPEGFILQTAASGEEALALVRQDPPDLILLDVMMPRMDGYEVAAALKGTLATRSIPIVMITGLDDQAVKAFVRDAGAEDFVAKPVDRADLCLRVKKLLPARSGS